MPKFYYIKIRKCSKEDFDIETLNATINGYMLPYSNDGSGTFPYEDSPLYKYVVERNTLMPGVGSSTAGDFTMCVPEGTVLLLNSPNTTFNIYIGEVTQYNKINLNEDCDQFSIPIFSDIYIIGDMT